MRESKIEAYLVKRVESMAGEVRKVQWVGRAHAPDRLVMLPPRGDRCWVGPRTVWVELKATGEVARPGQVREHERMRKLGQAVVVIDSLAGVDALLS